MDFNGTDQFVNLGIAAIPDITNHTITTWCNLDNISLAGGNRSLVNMDDILAPNEGITLYIKGEDDATAGRIGGVISGFQFTADVKITVDNWHLAAIRGQQSVPSTTQTVGILGVWESENTSPSHSSTSSGNNRLLILFVCNETTTDAAAVTSITYGGESMTFVDFVEVDDTTNGRVEMWILKEAEIAESSGTTFIVTFPGSGDVGYSHVFLENVDQNVSTGDVSKNTVIGDIPTIATSSAVTASVGELVVGCAITGNALTFTPNNGFTEGTDQVHAGIDGTSQHSAIYKSPTGGSEIPSVTVGGTVDRSAIIGIEINQSSTNTIYLAGDWESGTTHSFTPTGSNRLLVFYGSNETGTDNVILSTVTYGTESLTLVGRIEADATINSHIEMWILKEVDIATAASTTFVPTWSSGPTDAIYSHAFFTSVDQTTSTGTTETATVINADTTVLRVGSWQDAGFVDSDQDPITGTITESGTDNTDRAMIVVCAAEPTTANAPIFATAATWGGQSMTIVGSNDFIDSTGAREGSVVVFYLNEAGIQAASSTTLSTTWNDTVATGNRREAVGGFFINVDQEAPYGEVNLAETQTNLVTYSTTSAGADSMHVLISQSNATSATYTATSISGLSNFDLTNFAALDSQTIGLATATSDGSVGQTRTMTTTGTTTRNGGVVFVLNRHAFLAPVTVDSGGYTTSTATTTYNHTAPVGSNRLLIYHATHNDTGTDSTISGVPTYGTQSMTLVGTETVGTGPYNRVYIFSLDESGIAAATTTAVAWTWTPEATPDRQIHASAFYVNVDQVTPTGGYVSNTANPAVTDISTSAITNDRSDLILGVASCGQGTSFTPNNSFIEGFDTLIGTSTATGIYKSTTGTDETPSVTKAASGNRLVIGAARLNVSANVGLIGSWQNVFTDNDANPLTGTVTESGVRNSNRLLVVIFTAEFPAASTDPTVTSATWGGQSMTSLVSNDFIDPGGARSTQFPGFVAAWYLNELDIQNATSTTLSSTWSGTPLDDRREALAMFFVNIDQTSPFTEAATADGAPDPAPEPVTLTFSTSSASSGDMHVIATHTNDASNDFEGATSADSLSSKTNHTRTHFSIESQSAGIVTAEADGTGSQVRSITVDDAGGFYRHGGITFTLTKATIVGITDTISTAAIASSMGEMIVAGAVSGTTGSFAPNNSFTEGVDTSGLSSQHTDIFKPSTGASETPSTTFATDASTLAMFAVELNVAIDSKTVDVSLDGGTWTNLVTGDTSNLKINATDQQNIARFPGDDSYVDGSLTDIRIYNRQLSQAEIQTIYESKGEDGIVHGLLGRWPMRDSAIGTTPGSIVTPLFIDSTETSDTSTSSLAVTVPTQISGDLLIACIVATTAGDPGPTIATPIGWTVINTADLPTAVSTPRLAVFRREAAGVNEATTHLFVPSATSGMLGQMMSYRNVSHSENDTQINSGTTLEPSSPSAIGSNSVLVLRICATDDNEVPATEADFYPSGTSGREATEIATPGNGCSLGTADEVTTSVVTRSWTTTQATGTEEWRALTITFLSGTNGVIDVSDAKNDGFTSNLPITIETELR